MVTLLLKVPDHPGSGPSLSVWCRLSGASTACDFLSQLDPITLFGEHQGNRLACTRGAVSHVEHASVLPECVPLDLCSRVAPYTREDRVSSGPNGTPEGEGPGQGSSVGREACRACPCLPPLALSKSPSLTTFLFPCVNEEIGRAHV